MKKCAVGGKPETVGGRDEWTHQGFQGKAVEIRDEVRDVAVKGWLYGAEEAGTIGRTVHKNNQNKIEGLVLLAPGSSGGMGPGVNKCPIPFENAPDEMAYGSLYSRLGHELGAGKCCSDWNSCLTLPEKKRTKRNNMKPKPYRNMVPKVTPCLPRCVTLQIDWTIIPKKTLRRMPMLQSAVADVLVGVQFLKEKYPGIPLVLVGFSFGGPAVWPSAVQMVQTGDGLLAGVCSVAGSARGGDAYSAAGLNTKECVEKLDENVAKLFLQGTHDRNVALQVAEYLFDATPEPKCFARVNYALHMLNLTRDKVYPFFREGVVAAILRWHRRQQPARTESVREDAGSIDAEIRFRQMFSASVRLGRSLETRPTEVEGKERWRRKPSKKRLQKIVCDADHVLAGLVGFSM